MTSPDPTSPDSASPTGTDLPQTPPPTADPARPEQPAEHIDVAQAEAEAAPALDAGTYESIREPRNPNRLPLGDGTWHQISPKYVVVQFIVGAVIAVITAAAWAFLQLVWDWNWVAWVAVPILAITVLPLLVLPRQARSYGYQLRDDDLVFRRGILWQRMVAVPYGRMQLVDITHGPLDRGFGLAQLKLVTAAASTGVTIPGLTQEAAETLRDTLIDVAETRRTGL